MTGRTGPEGRGTLGEAAAGQSIGIVSGAAAAQAPALDPQTQRPIRQTVSSEVALRNTL